MTELDQVEEAIHTFFNAAIAALEMGVNEVDLCWALEGIIDAWMGELHQEMEAADELSESPTRV